MTYNPKIVLAYFKECGLPEPMLEYKFHEKRKWRFDFAWIGSTEIQSCGVTFRKAFGVSLEVQGGIFIQGGHNRGAALQKEHEKRNEAARLGWRILYVEPKDLCTQETVRLIKACLGSP